jgi:hypothetical protein
MERVFSFTPQTLEEQLREAVTPFVQRNVICVIPRF